MTKKELERIKQAYYSGLKIQIWFGGFWENFDIREYSMYSEPFSEHRRYRIVGSAYADIAEQRIAELEKENERLLSFAVERTECCDVCPQRNTCINSEGGCPYEWALLGNEKETTKKWLKDFIKEE